MFCPKCGHPAADGVRFCEHCGTPLTQSGGEQPEAYIQPEYVQPAYAGPRSMGAGRALARSVAMSPLFLTGAIAYSVMIVATLIASLTGGNSIYAALMNYIQMLSSMGVPELNELTYQLSSTLYTMGGVSLVGTLLGMLPSLLVLAGIWMTFAAAIDRNDTPASTAGLTIIKVLQILNLVCICLILAVVEFILILALIMSSNYVSDATPVVIVVMIVVAFVFALMIAWYVNLIKTIGSIQQALRAGVVSSRISSYVAGFTMVSGIFQLLGVLNFGSIFSLLAAIAGGVSSIAFSLLLFNYKNRMLQLQSGVNTAPQPAPQPAYQPEPQPAPQPVYQPEPPVAPQPVYQPEPPVAPQPAYQPEPQVAPQPVYQPEPQPPTRGVFPPPTQPVAETTVLSPTPETTVLQTTRILPTLRLIRTRDNSVVVVDRPQFRIGRDPGVADCIISDNTAVGRQHADIVQHDGQCFVVDLFSTNHTYVNGQQVPPGTEYPVNNGDIIVLGDECFQVDISGM